MFETIAKLYDAEKEIVRDEKGGVEDGKLWESILRDYVVYRIFDGNFTHAHVITATAGGVSYRKYERDEFNPFKIGYVHKFGNMLANTCSLRITPDDLKKIITQYKKDGFSPDDARVRSISSALRIDPLMTAQALESIGKNIVLTEKQEEDGKTVINYERGDLFFLKIGDDQPDEEKTKESYESFWREKVFESDRAKASGMHCQLCGRGIKKGETYFKSPKAFKFFTFDKESFLPENLSKERYKVYPVCRECGEKLFAGRVLADKRLRFAVPFGLHGDDSGGDILLYMIPQDSPCFATAVRSVSRAVERARGEQVWEKENTILSVEEECAAYFDMLFLKRDGQKRTEKVTAYLSAVPQSRIADIKRFLRESSDITGREAGLYTLNCFLSRKKGSLTTLSVISDLFTILNANPDSIIHNLNKGYLNRLEEIVEAIRMNKKTLPNDPKFCSTARYRGGTRGLEFLTWDYVTLLIFINKLYGRWKEVSKEHVFAEIEKVCNGSKPCIFYVALGMLTALAAEVQYRKSLGGGQKYVNSDDIVSTTIYRQTAPISLTPSEASRILSLATNIITRADMKANGIGMRFKYIYSILSEVPATQRDEIKPVDAKAYFYTGMFALFYKKGIFSDNSGKEVEKA